MTFVENIFWPISIASGVLAYLALLNETPYANWFIIISAVTGILAVVIGTVRHAVRAILTGVIGLSLGLSAWFGYRLYQNAEGWLTGVAQTGWITPSEIRFAKGLIILFPAVAVIAIALLIRQAQIIKVSDFKPQLQKTGKKGPLDVEVCKVGNRPVIIKHHDRYLHTMCIGTTGTGKSSRVLKPMIEQDLKAIAKGEKLGVTIIEPKGDFADDVAAMCRSMKVPYIYINPLNPATPRFNPMSGEPELVAEIMRTV